MTSRVPNFGYQIRKSQPMKTSFDSPSAIVKFAVVVVVLASGAHAQDWRDSAFPVKEHDFGTVAVGAKTEHSFQVVNHFSSPMRFDTVRASCGCTTPTIIDRYIEPGQTGSIHAKFNTDTFRGKKGATLTLVMTQPFYSEIRLKVNGYIRSDMVFYPGAIDFGPVAQGELMTKSTKILYAGRPDWEVIDVRSNKPWLIPRVSETKRENGTVNYELIVDVREDAPSGAFMDELVVTTNDRKMPNVPLKVSGNVESQLAIAPLSLPMGSVKPGEPIVKKLVLIGKSPFTIGSVRAEGWEVGNIDFGGVAKKMHIIYPELTYIGDRVGPQKVSLAVETEGRSSVRARTLITADVRGE